MANKVQRIELMRINKNNNKGFTLIEIMISMVIMSVLLYYSSSASMYLYRDYKFNDYVNKLEYLAKYAKIYSIKNSSYTGLCINNKTLSLIDMGANKSGSQDACGNVVKTINTIKISESYISVKPNSANSTNFIFDPRGIAYSANITDYSNINNNANALCLSDNKKSIMLLVGLTGISSQEVIACP